VLITCLYHESKESARKRPGGAVTIVVGYIPSPQGEAALDAALAEARTHDSELVVLNVSRGEALMEPKRLYDEQAAELTKRLEESGVRYTLRREVHPEPSAENVLDVLTELRPQLLVIGLRKRTATGKLLFGSTAQRLLIDAPCPVLAVKDPADY
jgi:nucleotide-binding universal stress UspA family protein